MEIKVMIFIPKKYFFYITIISFLGISACDQNQHTEYSGFQIHNTLDSSPNQKQHMPNIRKIPVKDFFKNPERVAYKLSPNGEYIAYLAPYQSRLNIFVKAINENEATRVTSTTDRDLSGFFWANNERLMYIRDFGGDENFHLFSVKKDGSEEKDLTPFEGVRVMIIDDLAEDEDHMLVGMNKRHPQLFDPYRINIHSGELTQIAENRGDITEWITDHKGKLRIAVATNGVNTTLLYRASEQDTFEAVATHDFKISVYPMYFDFDNSETVYALSNKGRDKLAIIKMNIRTGEELELIYEHPEVDVTYMSYSKKRKVPTTISYTTWKRKYKFVDPQIQAHYKDLETQLGTDHEISITSTTKEEDKFIIRTYNDRSLGAYYYYDTQNKELKELAKVGSWLKKEELATMKPIQYKSRDGLTICGYLSLPVGVKAKNLPVVINPHGGPWARDSWGFNPEVQFLCNRGYAVLQMNFRGSTGYGREFWQASFKEWGLKMQDDVTDGVNWLIKEGIADPDRIAIYGGSYGGYSTLAGITFTPDLYACAVDYVGVSNLFTFMETIPPYWEPYRKMLYEMVGNPEDSVDNARLKATSPVFHVDKIKAPLLIAQGAKDPRVKQAESDQMVEALRNRNINVDYILKENEGHGFHNEENRFEFYERMEAFLDMHLQLANVEE
ncbi:MAG: S9 family peptidase [Saprospiraceae bacterium]|nr:S9 family peptidase [Saprospiraceae bacterium]